MATIIQPPFYAPRPSDDFQWNGPLPLAAKTLASLTQQKEFGQGGQVPNVLRKWDIELNEPVWQGRPFQSAVLSLLLTVGGKIKPRRPWNFGLDDPSVWSGSPLESALLAQILTAAGKVKPRWPWHFELDDTSLWTFEGQLNRSLLTSLIVSAPFLNPPWVFGGNDAAVWQGQSVKSALLADLLTVGGQVKPRVPWNFGLNEPPEWYGQPLPNQERNLILLTTQAATPIVNPPFRFGYDDNSYWVGSPFPTLVGAIPPPFVPPVDQGTPAGGPPSGYFSRKRWEELKALEAAVRAAEDKAAAIKAVAGKEALKRAAKAAEDALLAIDEWEEVSRTRALTYALNAATGAVTIAKVIAGANEAVRIALAIQAEIDEEDEEIILMMLQ